MTREGSKRSNLNGASFGEAKVLLQDLSVAEVSKEMGLSETTVRRIKRSDTFTEYRGYIAASNGNKQFNENEFEKNLNAIEKDKDSYNLHFEDSTIFEPIIRKDDTPSSFGVILIVGIVLVVGIVIAIAYLT